MQQKGRRGALPLRGESAEAAANGAWLSVHLKRFGLPWIAVMSAALYLPSVRAPFVLDDLGGIVGNPRIVGVDGFLKGIPHMARPLTEGLLAATFAAGGENPLLYHVCGAVLHAVCVLLAGMVVAQALKDSGWGPAASWNGALLGAAVFGLHPLQSESVVYAVQAYSVLPAAALGLGAFLLGRQHVDGGGLLSALSACILASLAGLARQDAVVVPLLLMSYVSWIVPPAALGKAFGRRVFYVCFFLFAAVPVLAVVSATAPAIKASGAGFGVPGLPVRRYAATQTVVIFRYLKLFLFPVGQSLDHYAPLYPALNRAVVLAAGGWVAVGLLWVRFRTTMRLVAFGGFWFLVCLAPTSSFFPLRDAMFEHRCYMAILGLILAGLGASGRWWGRCEARNLAMFGVALGSVLAALTLMRGQVWTDAETLWADAVAKGDGNPRPWNNLAAAELGRGRWDAASEHLHRALQADPQYALAHYNLGLVGYAKGDFQGAVFHFREATALEPGNGVFFNNLGNAYASLRDFERAEWCFRRALELVPHSGDARANLALLLLTTGRGREASAQARASLLDDPGNRVALEVLRRAQRSDDDNRPRGVL